MQDVPKAKIKKKNTFGEALRRQTTTKDIRGAQALAGRLGRTRRKLDPPAERLPATASVTPELEAALQDIELPDGRTAAIYIETMESHSISAESLPDLSNADLREIGVPIGHRKAMLTALERLRKESHATDNPQDITNDDGEDIESHGGVIPPSGFKLPKASIVDALNSVVGIAAGQNDQGDARDLLSAGEMSGSMTLRAVFSNMPLGRRLLQKSSQAEPCASEWSKIREAPLYKQLAGRWNTDKNDLQWSSSLAMKDIAPVNVPGLQNWTGEQVRAHASGAPWRARRQRRLSRPPPKTRTLPNPTRPFYYLDSRLLRWSAWWSSGAMHDQPFFRECTL